jgi:hypothetical protein
VATAIRATPFLMKVGEVRYPLEIMARHGIEKKVLTAGRQHPFHHHQIPVSIGLVVQLLL